MKTESEKMSEPVSEEEVRRLRDNVYGRCDDHTWRVCGPNWCKPENIRWLRSRRANQQSAINPP
jgi:hypothetical protein